MIVNYDIGELAGEHGGIGAFAEVLRGGSRERLSRSGEGAPFPTAAARAYRSLTKGHKASR